MSCQVLDYRNEYMNIGFKSLVNINNTIHRYNKQLNEISFTNNIILEFILGETSEKSPKVYILL